MQISRIQFLGLLLRSIGSSAACLSMTLLWIALWIELSLGQAAAETFTAALKTSS